MKVLKHLFENNRKWAASQKQDPIRIFSIVLSDSNLPNISGLDAADSRVPANEIVGLLPGELFVHRNVANLVLEDDLNCLSVIQFAVDILKVKHIIVCGHYGCGGVKAVLENTKLGLTDKWLLSLKDIRDKYSTNLIQIKDDTTRFNKLCELNVVEQVFNVCKTDIVQKCMAEKSEFDCTRLDL